LGFLFVNVNHEVGFEASESIPISMGYIIAAMKQQGWEGVILDDLRDRPLSLANLEKWIRRVDPPVIGFTAYQSTLDRIRFLCRYIKSRHRRIYTVLGGPQAIVAPSEALEELEDVDALVRGEAELVMPEMARTLAAGETLERVTGIACRSNGRFLDTGPGPEPPSDLDFYPSPYLMNLLNLEGKNTAILLSSRGCSHVCRFCITPRICKGKVRYHSVERVLSEMELLSKNGIERFWFADPNFTEDRARTEELLAKKIERGIATPFWLQTRSDLIDAELLEKLREAGADTVAFGLESGSEDVLEKTNKGIKLDRLRENVEKAQSLGMDAELFSIFGLPGETIEDARRTIEFVRSLGVSIQSNSGSQQMQLYFGSIYEKNPERYGIKVLPGYRPFYFSAGEQYETESMSQADIKKARNLWALANEQMERDVYYKQRIFDVIEFLLENQEDLREEPAFCHFGALAANAIEEFDLMIRFLEAGRHSLKTTETLKEIISGLTLFKETDQPSGPMDRVIFDSRSWIDDIPFTGISGKYWDVLLGRGLLLPAFEQGLIGVRQGQEAQFSFVFPEDYYQEELRDKEVRIQAKIHKVFNALNVKNIEELKDIRIRNRFAFQDLDLLKEQNEILYYLALRDSDELELLNKPGHFLNLVQRLAKLGKRKDIIRMAGLLHQKPAALNALADTLAGTGKCSWALEYYYAVSESMRSSVLKRVQCLLRMEMPGEAMKLLETVPETPDLQFQEMLLECLKAARPESDRIPSLQHNVLELRIKAALDREAMMRSGNLSPPIVHGLPHGGPAGGFK
jgi:anaerobic magnesium-protoporphyrin IX monomethyl ester cyclase